MFWQDGQGVPLAGNVTTSQMANEQGLFDVRSVLRVVLGANGTYSCLVRNPVLQQDAHGSVAVTGKGHTNSWGGWGEPPSFFWTLGWNLGRFGCSEELKNHIHVFQVPQTLPKGVLKGLA